MPQPLKESGLINVARNPAGPLRRSNAGKQGMARIGCPHAAWPLSSVERQGIGADFLAPECCLEPLPKVLGFLGKSGR